MKVGIIGSGVVGQTLAAGFLKHGHQVEIGTRDPAKLKEWSAMLWSLRSEERLRGRR
jgi:predicted dinucleotide-binding enzyme